VSPSVDGDVLNALTRSALPLTGREVARLCDGRSQSGVRAALNRLVDHGVVDTQPAGRSILYSLNRDHVATAAIEALIDLRAEAIARMREAVAMWPLPPFHLSIFGSFARGDGSVKSDIDILVVRPAEVKAEDTAWLRQTNDFAMSIHRWTGNRASVSEIEQTDVSKLASKEPAIVKSLTNEAIVLHGPDIRSLLENAN
jgi:DNA-binding transcriptional ArsR family regulator